MREMKQMGAPKFVWGDFLKKLAVIAIPIALQNLLSTTASMVDTMMVAPLGELSVGALGLCAQFTSLMFSCYWGFVGGGMLFISQYWGAKDEDGIDKSYGLMLTCLMAVAFVFGISAVCFPETVMKLYTDKVVIQEIGVSYFRIVGFAYVLQVLSVCMSSLLRSTERVKIPLIASIVSVATNLFLNWVFIYGNLGAPAMGIQGAALATSIAALVNVLMIYLMARLSGYPFLFHVRKHFQWGNGFLKMFMVKCFPIVCNEVFLGIGNMIINVTLGRQDAQVIAALAVFRTIEGMIIGFFAGFSSASSVLVGKCVGAGELRMAYERAKRLVYLCSAFILFVGVIIFAFHDPLLHVMSLHDASYEAGTVLLAIYLAVAVIRMGNWIHNDTYRAAGDAVFGTVLEIIFMYALVVPGVLLSGFVWKAPYYVVFLCAYADEPIRYVIIQFHLYSGKWIKPVTELGQKALPEFREGLRK